MARQTLYLLDAHALCYRAFYAVKGLTSSKGQPTNAVYGFVNVLRKMLKDFEPQYFAVCFDKDGKAFRLEKYKEYKIQRPSMPDDLVSQMPLIRSVVQGYGLPVMEVSGYEADDLIATATRQFQDADVDIVIITDDKDLFQLVDKHVAVYSPRKEAMLTKKGVEEIMGVAPKHVADFIGLAGDSSDNIPGVQGIGKVTAQKLIQQFGSLDDIYAGLDKIASRSVREKLEAQQDQAFLSRELAQLRMDAPVSQRLDDWKVCSPDAEALFAFFTELDFHRFAADVQTSVQGAAPSVHPETVSLKEVEQGIAKQKRFAFCFDGQEEDRLFITDGRAVAQVGPKRDLAQIRKIFDNGGNVVCAHDIKQQYKTLREWGLDCKGQVFDVMLAGYLLNPVRNGQELSTLLWQHFKEIRPEDSGVAQDILSIFRLYEPLYDDLLRRQALDLFEEIEMPLARILASMEQTGVRIDLNLLEDLSADCQKKMDALQQDIYRLAKEEFNINSPKQLSHILFEKLKLPVIKKTKTGFSTNEEVLLKLAARHPLPEKILEYRQLAKLKSTYIDALPALAAEQAGPKEQGDIVHTSFNQTVTETGRLSSSNPNLQNIPVRTELGRQIRRAFIPLRDDRLLLAADYSQIELRVLAHLSGDDNLISAFAKDEDIHVYTAALMFDMDAEDVTDDMRTAAKRVNFGIIYGMSAFGLAKDLNVSYGKAQDFIDRYFFRYPKVKDFMDQAVEECRKKGYASTLMNRHREIPEIVSKNIGIRQFAERQAINTPVQGTAADLIKMAMVRVQQELDRTHLKSRMLITVHDEIVFDMVPSEEKTLVSTVKRAMEGAMSLKVPIKVTIKKGPNWLDMEKVV